MAEKGSEVKGRVEGETGSWLIGLIALGVLLWAVVEIIDPGGSARAGGMASFPTTAEQSMLVVDGFGVEAVEMHRLLPDATASIGRAVELDGTVVGEVMTTGFWVRDFRDNIVFVATPRAVGVPVRVRAGDAVRIRGVVALLSPTEQAARLAGAGLVLPASATVVHDVQILPSDNGIERIAD